MAGSGEFLRQIQLTQKELHDNGIAEVLGRIHPDDVERVRAALIAATDGEIINFEVRAHTVEGAERTFHTVGELVCDSEGHPMQLRGSIQDITDQILAKQASDAAAADKQTAAHERLIAEELQRSLLPVRAFTPKQLKVATHYQAGVDDTQVGGDWYDVIELDRDRTALVVGDVMGRGIRAAAVMGQLRATIRAYAQLDLSPTRVLEHLDATIREISEEKIATCIYAVFDPQDRSLVYANAGHLPPLVRSFGGATQRLIGTFGPPLGTGPHDLVETKLTLSAGDVLTLYTDGLVEHRGSDIEHGIDDLVSALAVDSGRVEDLPLALVAALLPNGSDDDVAVLVAEVPGQASGPASVMLPVPAEAGSVASVRRFTTNVLAAWAVTPNLTSDLVVVVGELITNAILHSQSPIELRLSRTTDRIVVAVHDGTNVVPRMQRTNLYAEHGRGLQLVASLTDRWGVRPTGDWQIGVVRNLNAVSST